MRFLARLLITAAALWVSVKVIPGIDYHGPWYGLIVVALVFGGVNAIIRPILFFLTCPLVLVTLGLFTLVLNAFMLILTSKIAGAFGFGFEVSGFLPAFFGAIVIGLTSAILNTVVADDDEPYQAEPPKQPQ